MIKLEKTDVYGWEAAIRGMRNPLNSWEKSDTLFYDCTGFEYYDINGNSGPSPDIDEIDGHYSLDIGPNDMNLMMRLSKNGPVHAKFRRMITVTVDILAPLYWWKEFDTYKVGTVANSCSTMHKIAAKEFTLDDFSHEHLLTGDDTEDCGMYINEAFMMSNDREDEIYCMSGIETYIPPAEVLTNITISVLNKCREAYLKTKDKRYWWQMIQLLPSSYNQKRTVMLNYEVLADICASRRNHKLDEWHTFCDWAEDLPYSWIFTTKKEEVGDA